MKEKEIFIEKENKKIPKENKNDRKKKKAEAR